MQSIENISFPKMINIPCWSETQTLDFKFLEDPFYTIYRLHDGDNNNNNSNNNFVWIGFIIRKALSK